MSDSKIIQTSERGKPTIVQAPEGYSGAGFMTTSLEKAVGLARKNSIWPLPFATSCCGIEFMATMGANYDLARFGMERLSFSPRQSNLLMVMGLAPVVGIPLPLVSHGGTAMLTVMLCLGVLMSIDRHERARAYF